MARDTQQMSAEESQHAVAKTTDFECFLAEQLSTLKTAVVQEYGRLLQGIFEELECERGISTKENSILQEQFGLGCTKVTPATSQRPQLPFFAPPFSAKVAPPIDSPRALQSSGEDALQQPSEETPMNSPILPWAWKEDHPSECAVVSLPCAVEEPTDAVGDHKTSVAETISGLPQAMCDLQIAQYGCVDVDDGDGTPNQRPSSKPKHLTFEAPGLLDPVLPDQTEYSPSHDSLHDYSRVSVSEDFPKRFSVYDCFQKSNNGPKHSVFASKKKGTDDVGDKSVSMVSGILPDDDDDDEDDWHNGCFCIFMSEHLVTHPGSAKRLAWDLVGFVFVFYDAIEIPLKFFDPGDSSVMAVAAWLARMFWSIDMIFSFFTGYQHPDGHFEHNIWKVAIKYLKGWFALDALIVTVDWLGVFTEQGSSGAKASRGVAKFFRTMRVLRAIRLLRLIRLIRSPELTGKLSYFVRSEELMIILGILKIITIVTILIHFIACCWYGIGKGRGNWVEVYSMKDESLGYRYATSFHWALTQFNGSPDIMPQNHDERAFSVVVLMIAFVTSGVVVSSITTSMTRLQLVTQGYTKQLTLLRRYLLESNISQSLATRVLRNAKHVQAEEKRNINEESVQLLGKISTPLRVEIHCDMNGPVLSWHPFFRDYKVINPPAFRAICHVAISRQKVSKGDVIFAEGECPKPKDAKMRFLLTNDVRLMYHRDRRRPLFVEKGGWASEVNLWLTEWVNHGELRSMSECEMLCVCADKFHVSASQFQAREFFPARYAQLFCEKMNMARPEDVSELNTDTVDAFAIAKKVFGHLNPTMAKGASHSNLDRLTGRHSLFAVGNYVQHLSDRISGHHSNHHSNSNSTSRSNDRPSLTPIRLSRS